MDYLSKLENQSIYIMREAFNKFENLAMLWSIGKDSTVLLWLARKAFFGHVPFPLVHVDTTYKIPSMIEYRDRVGREWKLDLVVGKNEEVLRAGRTFPNGKATRVECCGTLKKDALKRVLEEQGYTGVIVGVRRDVQHADPDHDDVRPAKPEEEQADEGGAEERGLVDRLPDRVRAQEARAARRVRERAEDRALGEVAHRPDDDRGERDEGEPVAPREDGERVQRAGGERG